MSNEITPTAGNTSNQSKARWNFHINDAKQTRIRDSMYAFNRVTFRSGRDDNAPKSTVVLVLKQELTVSMIHVSNEKGEFGMTYYMYKDRQGYWRWYLQAANNRKLADSGEGYYNKQDCRNAIDLVASSAGAPVVVLN